MKNRLNHNKGSEIKGKIAKSSVTFRKNKPNSKNIKIGVTPFKTNKYEILPARRSKNQTQFKANTKPIHERPKMNVRNVITINYETFPHIPGKKTNPSKPKTKPIPPTIAVPATLIIDETVCPAYNHSDNF